MRVRLLTLLIVATLLFGTLPCLGAEKSCPPGALLNPYSGICAPINDVRPLYTMSQERHVSIQNIPSLTETRKENAVMRGLMPSDMPVPGGVGAGILYKNGNLQVLDSAQLHTKMFVHPNGLNPSGYLDWLFTPATNRTDSPVEIVGIYRSNQEEGSLGIYGRPCSQAYPCPNGSTVNSWQWFWLFLELECNMTEIVDQGSHLQTIIQYANNSEKLDREDPPLWRNRVYLWNFCTEEWDLLYEHHYRENKRDCSLDNITCGWWGPILETFGDDPQPEINELGFEDTLLYHDGTWSELSPSETAFEEPVSPWILFHLDPNRGYGVGNYFHEAPWQPAHGQLFQSQSDLALMRQYRDEFLTKRESGRLYKKLLYESSEEALEVLLTNPRLMLRAKKLIEANRDAVAEVVNGNRGVIYSTDEIVSFLDAFARKSPAALKLLANTVKREMLEKQEQGEPFLGFELH